MLEELARRAPRHRAFVRGGLASRDRLAPGLFRRHDHLTIDAAALEHLLEIDLLDRFEPQVLPHDLCCDQDDRCAVAIASFIKAVDEVGAAGAAGCCAGDEMASEQRFGGCREGAGLLMPHMHPIDLAVPIALILIGRRSPPAGRSCRARRASWRAAPALRVIAVHWSSLGLSRTTLRNALGSLVETVTTSPTSCRDGKSYLIQDVLR